MTCLDHIPRAANTEVCDQCANERNIDFVLCVPKRALPVGRTGSASASWNRCPSRTRLGMGLEIRCLDKVCHVHGAGPLGMAGPGFHEAGMMLTPGCASKLGSFSWPTWGSLCLKHMPCSLGVIATHESSHVFQEQDGHLQGARVQSNPYSANQKQVEAHSKYKGQVSNAPT